MRIVLINLERAKSRRVQMARGFEALGLQYEIGPAIDGRRLSADQLAQVDGETRRHLGLRPHDNGSIACWLSHREAMRDLVLNGPDMMAVFEDDARFAPELPAVLNALELKPFSFDVVALYRGHTERPFVPCLALTERVTVGRVRYSDSGLVGYVITREAARHFLATTRRMVLAVDHALLRCWVSGLNIFHVDPMMVYHGGDHDSQIDEGRGSARRQQRATQSLASVIWRRGIAGIRRAARKRLAFRRLLRGEIAVTHWPERDTAAGTPSPAPRGPA